jgi:hypothetical protein
MDLVRRYLDPDADARRHDWLYRDNPWGPALAWLALDEDAGVPVGMASAFPRRMRVGGRPETAWLLGDFCIRDDTRTLGVALKLQRACLAGVAATGARLCFDFPSQAMMAVYRRLAVEPWAEMTRLVRPLRLERHIRGLVKSAALARTLSFAVDPFLRMRRRWPSPTVGVKLADGPCGEEFAALAERATTAGGGWVERSPAYLDWRFTAHPWVRYERAEARRAGRLVAYAVFRQVGEQGLLEDLFGIDDRDVVTDLVESVTQVLAARGAAAVSATMATAHPWRPWLGALGFVPRESKPMVVCVSTRGSVDDDLPRGGGWFFMDGDRES